MSCPKEELVALRSLQQNVYSIQGSTQTCRAFVLVTASLLESLLKCTAISASSSLDRLSEAGVPGSEGWVTVRDCAPTNLKAGSNRKAQVCMLVIQGKSCGLHLG